MNKILILLLLSLPVIISAQVSSHEAITLMGCRFDITTVAGDTDRAENYRTMAIEEIQRIEQLISSWDPNSQTSAINQAAGEQPVTVDDELFSLIQRAIGLSQLTDGAFDISYASMDRLWKFDGSMKAIPAKGAIAASVARVGFQKIVLNEQNSSVYLPEKGMKIGFGAIGKGYAADRARKLLEKAGCQAGIINASGDLTAWGVQPSGGRLEGSDYQPAQ